MVTRFASALVLVITAAAVTPLAAQEPVVLRLDPPAGRISHQRLESRMWMVEGSELPSDTAAPAMTMLMWSTQSVAPAETGVRTITVVVDSSRVTMGNAMPMPGSSADWLKGMTTTRRVSDDGDVLSVTTVPGPNLPPMMAGRAPDFSGAAGRQTFPKRPLHIGDTWTDTITTPEGPGATRGATNVFTSTLTSIETRGGAQLATVSSRGVGGVAADSAHAVSVTGETTIEMVVDVTNRRMVLLRNEARTRINSPRGPSTNVVRVTITAVEP